MDVRVNMSSTVNKSQRGAELHELQELNDEADFKRSDGVVSSRLHVWKGKKTASLLTDLIRFLHQFPNKNCPKKILISAINWKNVKRKLDFDLPKYREKKFEIKGKHEAPPDNYRGGGMLTRMGDASFDFFLSFFGFSFLSPSIFLSFTHFISFSFIFLLFFKFYFP